MKAGDIAQNDLTVLVRFPTQLVEAMHGSAMKSLYGKVGRAVEEVGNVISAGGQPFTPELFLELLRRVDFGVDKEGRVTLPQLHLHPDVAKNVIPLLESQGPDFAAEVDAIKAVKEAEAREREVARKARFKLRREI